MMALNKIKWIDFSYFFREFRAVIMAICHEKPFEYSLSSLQPENFFS